MGGLIVAGVVGAAAGIAVFTFHEGKGLSYMSNDPSACINCHVMQEQYDGWLHGSHARSGTTCNDCHTPHDSTLAKYYVKAEHGYRHSKGFTLNDFHEPIQITPESKAVVAANCQRCHESISHDIAVEVYGKAHGGSGVKQGDALGLGSLLGVGKGDVGAADCLHCHSKVGHGPSK
jgi:cytochrome c nitrite reductase small subunit